jgi:hypothetical protein
MNTTSFESGAIMAKHAAKEWPDVLHNRTEERKTTMKIKTSLDLELMKMLGKELSKLKKYEDMFDDMTAEEKEELREWMSHGKSVNNNPYLLYEENGCLMDLITAIRIAGEMTVDSDCV